MCTHKNFLFVGGVVDGRHIAVRVGTYRICMPIPPDLRIDSIEPIKRDEYRFKRLVNEETGQVREIFLEVNMTIDDLNERWERTSG